MRATTMPISRPVRSGRGSCGRRGFFGGAVPVPLVCCGMVLSEMPAVAPVGLDLPETGEEALILAVAELLRHEPAVVDFPGMTQDLLIRQRDKPPLLGNGIALPHARTKAVTEPLLAVARSLSVVPFGPEAVPVRLVFLFVIPSARAHESLAMTAMLARMLRSSSTVEGLLAARDEEAFRRFLK
jgi:mannitol/fructose-specific phosphotransferase system IIA component (Ntr-type)